MHATCTRGRIAAIAHVGSCSVGWGSWLWLPPRACGLHGAVHGRSRRYVLYYEYVYTRSTSPYLVLCTNRMTEAVAEEN